MGSFLKKKNIKELDKERYTKLERNSRKKIFKGNSRRKRYHLQENHYIMNKIR